MMTPWINLSIDMARLGWAMQNQFLQMAMRPMLQQSHQAVRAATDAASETAGAVMGTGLTPAQAEMMRHALRSFRRQQRRLRARQLH